MPRVSKPGLQGPRGLAVARKEQGWQLSHSACPQPINLSRGQGSHGRIILFAGAKPQLWGINAGGYIKERGAGTRQCSASDPKPTTPRAPRDPQSGARWGHPQPTMD